MRGVGIGFEFLDATEGFPVSGSEIVVLGEDRFADTGGGFVESGDVIMNLLRSETRLRYIT